MADADNRSEIVDAVAHADVAVTRAAGAAFGDVANQFTILPTEIAAAQREFPILFADDGAGALVPVIITGLAAGDNLFFDDGRWTSRYVPAMQRRGPFLIGARGDGSGEPIVLIDRNDPRVGDDRGDADANRLFLPGGGRSPYLAAIIDTLMQLHEGVAMLPAMMAAFADVGLLQPLKLDVATGPENRVNFEGYHSIDGDRLRTLSGDQLARLAPSGLLAAAVHIAGSIDNFAWLAERHRRRHAPG